MKILIAGNPIDGFKLIGPFETDEKACDYAATHNFFAEHQENWWVMEPEKPEPEEKTEPEETRVRLITRVFSDEMPSVMRTLRSIGAENVTKCGDSSTQHSASRTIYFEGPAGIFDKALDAGVSVEEFSPDKL
jgi:hypothetical protein